MLTTLAKSDKASKGARRGIAGIGKAIAASGIGLLIAGAAAMASFASEALGGADEIARFSESLGFSKEGFQEWTFIAEQAGLEAEGVQAAARTLNEQLFELGNGNEDLMATFAGLGLSWEELQNQSPEEQFRAVAEAIAATEDPIARTTLANQLLGEEGVQLVAQLRETEGGFSWRWRRRLMRRGRSCRVTPLTR